MHLQVQRHSESGFALLLVVVFTSASLLVLTSILNWTSTSATITDRGNRLMEASAAAEAGIEKVCAAISRDFQDGGINAVEANLATYRNLAPSAEEDPRWADYTFEGGSGPLSVTRVVPWSFSELNIRYRGLKGYNATYRVVARASSTSANDTVRGTLRRDLVLASIPIFGFGVFYAVDMEICPGASTVINGFVHANGTNYFQPDSGLTFSSYVTSARSIIHDAHPEDPVFRTAGTIRYQAERDAGVVSLNLPIGTNNSPDNLRAMVEIPPPLAGTNSPLGRLRYYNKADMIIRVTDTNVIATSGAYNNFATSIPWTYLSRFLKTNVVFFNKRENCQVVATEFDLNELRNNYVLFTFFLGRKFRAIYVADFRTQTSLTQPGIRLVNGLTLPPGGLTLATPNPLYVLGNFNVNNSHLGTTNTSLALPASLVADAVTVLSGAWNDTNAGGNLSSRRAVSTTINAAVITGIVPTGGGYYSGGYENTLRLLEDWRGQTLTFNGSMAVLYFSRFATSPWGASPDVYDVPTRKWNFDSGLLNEARLPPATPELRVMFRGEWAILASSASL